MSFPARVPNRRPVSLPMPMESVTRVCPHGAYIHPYQSVSGPVIVSALQRDATIKQPLMRQQSDTSSLDCGLGTHTLSRMQIFPSESVFYRGLEAERRDVDVRRV